jgi:tellurite resistance protein
VGIWSGGGALTVGVLPPHPTMSATLPVTDNPQAMDSQRPKRGIGKRDRWFRLYPIALGLGGLSGTWRTAVHLDAPAWPAVSLAVLCLGAWIAITLAYVLQGGGNPGTFVADLRHPERGFAFGYIPVIPMLLLTNAAARTNGLRFLDLATVALWAVVTAAIVAHWITTPRERHAIHPGFSLPVVAGPFIACISLQANRWHSLAEGAFAVGVFFWMMFGSLIIGRLMTEQRLSDERFPTLAVLMVPPATASIAWFGLNDNRITTFGTGLAGVLAMMALIQLFILPEYLRRPFTLSAWSFSFPLAATANTVCHWAIAASQPVGRALAWSLLIVATASIGLLAGLTVSKVWRAHIRPAPSRGAVCADAGNARLVASTMRRHNKGGHRLSPPQRLSPGRNVMSQPCASGRLE